MDAPLTEQTPATEQPNRPEFSAKAALPETEIEKLTDDIIGALKTVYDPEIPADIYELGLIYRVDIEDDRSIKIDMTLTAPACPSRARCRNGCRTRSRPCRACNRRR